MSLRVEAKHKPRVSWNISTREDARVVELNITQESE
jgi:hypothetical protein